MILQTPGLVRFSPAEPAVAGKPAQDRPPGPGADTRNQTLEDAKEEDSTGVATGAATEAASEAASEAAKEDARLLNDARNGNRNSFRLLVDKYHGQVAAAVIGMLGPSPEARDIGQETFVRFYQSLDRFRGDAAVGTYLTRIAMNLCLNEIRRRKRHARLRSEAWEEGTRTVDGRDFTEARDMHDKTRAAILRLDPNFRAVVVVCWIEERTVREAADILGIPLGTALSRLHRARQQLRGWLDPEEET